MLTEAQFPYTGPYRRATADKPASHGPTAEALKRFLGRLAWIDWDPDGYDEEYNQKVAGTMSDWQISVGIAATGDYGKASWQKAREQKIQNGPHAGEYAMDAYGLALIRNEAIAKIKPKLVYPYPIGEGGKICQWLHPTAGLPGNWAIDFCDTPGARVLAVEAGTIQRLSGSDPADDKPDPAGTYGFNTYIRAAGGYTYFITHLDWQNPHCTVGSKVVAGTVIGKVGDQEFRPDHCHYGVSSTLGPEAAIKRIVAVSKAPRISIT